MTHLGTFIQNSPYPTMRLVYDESLSQLQVEGYGPITVGRLRELDEVGQVQWVNEDLRGFAYSLEQPQPQPQPVPVAEPSGGSSSNSIVTVVVAFVAIVAIAAIAYFAFTAISDRASDTQEPAPTQETPTEEAPADEAPPSTDTTS